MRHQRKTRERVILEKKNAAEIAPMAAKEKQNDAERSTTAKEVLSIVVKEHDMNPFSWHVLSNSEKIAMDYPGYKEYAGYYAEKQVYIHATHCSIEHLV